MPIACLFLPFNGVPQPGEGILQQTVDLGSSPQEFSVVTS